MHPAGVVSRLEQAGITPRPEDPLDGHARVYVDDPFGNRLEILDVEVEEPTPEA